MQATAMGSFGAIRSQSGLRIYEEELSMHRQQSSVKEHSSDALLVAILERDIIKVRELVHGGLGRCHTYSLFYPSYRKEFYFRTALMTAAATREYDLFSTVKRAFEGCCEGSDDEDRRRYYREQLCVKDEMGMTLVMIAASSGNVLILGNVLHLMVNAKAPDTLVDMDYNRKTVLMHACSSGNSAMFVELFRVTEEYMEPKSKEAKNGEEDGQLAFKFDDLLAVSGDSKTLLMHAAGCGDQMTLEALSNTFRRVLEPKKIRSLIKARDFEGMTFLMHAARSGESSRKCRDPTERRSLALGASERSGGTSEVTGVSAPSTGEAVPVASQTSDASPAAPDNSDGRQQEGASAPQDRGSPQAVAANDPPNENYNQDEQYDGKAGVVIFKTAFHFVTTFLWREQIRDQIKAKDSWGRTILTHAVLSGNKDIFEAAFHSMRKHIPDWEVDNLLAIDSEDSEESAMEAAISSAPREMRDTVSRRHEELKKSVAVMAKASSVQAKIQAFIPGKFIVVFQLIYAELDKESNDPLVLLSIMCALAPIFAFAGSLVEREMPSSTEKREKSIMNLLLAAPAFFFWGIGTSTIAKTSFGWNDSSSSVALAVATIAIPSMDAFFSSRLIRRWWDKIMCKKYHFSKKARKTWKEKDKMVKAGDRRLPLVTLSPNLPDLLSVQIHPSTPVQRASLRGAPARVFHGRRGEDKEEAKAPASDS